MIHTEWHLTPPFYPCQPAMLTEKREAQNKLLREGEVSSGSRFPRDLALSHRRDSINLHSPNFKKPECLRRANTHMYKHNFYLFPDSPQHFMSTTHIHTCQKNNPLGHIISWQAVLLFCVCQCRSWSSRHSGRLMGKLTLGWPRYLEGKWWQVCLPTNFTQLGQPPSLQRAVSSQEFAEISP